MSPRIRVLASVGLYLLAMCVLAFEVALSRVLAATTGYHMAFLAISLTIFGLGCGGFGLFWLRRSGRPWAVGDLPVQGAALLFPLSLLVFVVLLVLTPLSQHWLPFIVTTLFPFLFAGVIFSHLFRVYAREASFLYAFDLLGAAMGCLVVVLLLHLLGGGIRATLAVGLLACGPLLVLGALTRAGRGYRLAGVGVLGLLAAALALSLFTDRLDLDPMRFVGMREYIDSRREAGDRPVWQPELSSWDEFSRVDVVHYQGGTSNKHIFINGRTPANMVAFDGRPEGVEYLRRSPGYVAFVSGKTEEVCCIGAGGGVDILVSLLGGARRIDAVEINPGVVAATLRDGAFNGGVFRFDAVQLYVEDGRSFLSRHPERLYDVIYLSLVQSITGDFTDLAFVEDYLYTVQAVESYYRHLKPDGRVVMEIHHERLLYRYLATLAQMLKNQGVPPERIAAHIGAFAYPKDAEHESFVTLLFATPPGREQLAAVVDHVTWAGGRVLSLGQTRTDPILERFIHGEGMLSIGGTDLSPCTDDKPFFFRHSPSFIAMMFQIWGGVLLANILLVGFLWRGRRKLVADGRPEGLGVLIAYFMVIGINYTLVQIVVMQKSILFLGYPTLSLSVVLFTMLVGSGLGSYVSMRFRGDLLGLVRWVLLAVGILGFAYAFGLGGLYRIWMGAEIGLKMLAVVGVLFPISFLLGMPMPLGLRSAEGRFSEGIPYFWGLNGTASVLGSLTATVIAMSQGFTSAWLVAILLTMILLLILHRMRSAVS